MRYQIRHARVQYAANVILPDVNFEIRDREKVAIVGRNGCGKTTLLKLIAGDIEMSNLDSDEECGIFTAGKQRIGMLRQISFPEGEVSVEDEIKKVFEPIYRAEAEMKETEDALQSADPETERRLLSRYDALQKKMEALRGYTWKQDMETVFQKFGFQLEDLKRPIGTFSGGQQTKVAFIKLLLEHPDILLLDEPTNHLDIVTIEWLEFFLKSYDGAVVIVSHDRMFLDRIIDVTYEIEYGEIKRYPGNYTAFMERKDENTEKQEKDYELQQKEIARLTEWIEKWKNTPTKVAATRSKRMAIEHMVKIEKPRRYDTKTFRAHFTPRRESYTDVLSVRNLGIGYDTVLSRVTFELKKGDRLAVIGENGKGKSTLLKTLIGEVPAHGGSFSFGTNVDMAYFDQQKAVINDDDPEETILDNFWNTYPNLMREEVRSALGAFMFSQEEVTKLIGQLSGGEKVRLALCKILYTKPNLLILDEPTNHVDIMGKDALERMLRDFTGTVLFVSHDRYFIRRIATGILDFDGDMVRRYYCGYEEYLEEREKRRLGIITDTYGGGSSAGNGSGNGRSSGSGKNGGSGSEKTGGSGSEKTGNAGAGAGGNGTGSGRGTVPTLDDVFDKKTYYNPGKIVSRLKKTLEKYADMLEESEQKAKELSMALLDPELAADYSKLMEIQEQLDAENRNQESILERMLETELELQEMEEKE